MRQVNVHKNMYEEKQKEFTVSKELEMKSYNGLLKSVPFWKLANIRFKKDKLSCLDELRSLL